MADNVVANPGAGGATFASDDIGGVQYPRNKITLGADGANDGDVSASNPMPVTGTVVTGGLTDAELRASPVDVTGTVTTGGLTDAELRASPVDVAAAQDGAWTTGRTWTLSSGTDSVAVPGTVAVTQSGPWNVGQAGAWTVDVGNVSGTVAISAAALPLPSGAATDALQVAGNASLATIAGKDFATETTLATRASEATLAELPIDQGTDVAGLKGPMVQALVSDTSQSYTPDQIRPLSMTADGRLRVSSVDSLAYSAWGCGLGDFGLAQFHTLTAWG